MRVRACGQICRFVDVRNPSIKTHCREIVLEAFSTAYGGCTLGRRFPFVPCAVNPVGFTSHFQQLPQRRSRIEREVEGRGRGCRVRSVSLSQHRCGSMCGCYVHVRLL